MPINAEGLIVSPVLKCAKFSPEIVKGGNKAKKIFIKRQNSEIVKFLQTKNDGILVNDFRKFLQNKFSGKNIEIYPLKVNFFSVLTGLEIPVNKDLLTITGAKIYCSAKKGLFRKEDFPVLIHELTHLFESFAKPKIPLAEIQLKRNYGKDYHKILKFYNKTLYSNYEPRGFGGYVEESEYLKSIEKKTRKFLKQFPPEEALSAIQACRYAIMSEKLAYSESSYASRKIFNGCNLEQKREIAYSKTFLWSEKAALLKKIGFEKVKEIREANKAGLKNQ